MPDGWNDARKYFKNAKKIYGLTTWETTHLHAEWTDYINLSVVHEVIVPSRFNKKTFIDSGVNKNVENEIKCRFGGYQRLLEATQGHLRPLKAA